MVKICLVVRSLTQGGVRRFIENILLEMDRLQTDQFELHVVCDELYFGNKFNNITYHCIRAKNKVFFDYFLTFYYLRKNRFDVLIYPKNVIPLTHFLLKGKKLNIIHDLGYFESNINAYPLLDTLFMKTFMKITCKLSDKIFAVSDFTKQDIIKRFKINKEKIVVIYEGVEEKFKVIKDIKRLKSTVNKYDLYNEFIFYAGSVSPRKNLIRVIGAFNRIKDKIPHDLVITGGKIWGAKVFENNSKNHFDGRVKRLGYVSDEELIDLYNMAQIYIYPSLYEGFGLPILEAQKCGCPVITSNLTSCPEVAGNAAVIVDPYSENEIAEGIIKITMDNKFREELVKKGYENVKRYDWRKTALILEEWFYNL